MFGHRRESGRPAGKNAGEAADSTVWPAALSAVTSHASGGTSVLSAFTLIELILVMAILTIAVSITAPALGNFFRGRSLDSEARRLLSLIHAGQSRAVSEGVPMELWVDAAQGAFGLEAEPSYETEDSKAVDFHLDNDVQIEAVYGEIPGAAALALSSTSTSTSSSTTGASSSPSSSAPVRSNHPNLPCIRFLPDGSLGETSPQRLRLVGRDGFEIWLAQSRNRLSYEISNRNN
jgi:prepilin-type N-terminal cleavage/methylation domain-containing protein